MDPHGATGHQEMRPPTLLRSATIPPYATHDWVADHALSLLPNEEKAWIVPHQTLYLVGTEAPDNRNIPNDCGAPHNGYDDGSQGLSVDWNSDHSEMVSTRAARRAQEEYSKATIAYEEGDLSAAAFYLGAMAHYIGDVSQYGHAYPDEENHSNYEGWVRNRTESFNDGVFESYVQLDSLVRRRPYTLESGFKVLFWRLDRAASQYLARLPCLRLSSAQMGLRWA